MSDKDKKDIKFLEYIDDPFDLRKLEPEDLTQVADEIRAEIITGICEIGGHLASGLGVVELTIALHYVFNTPDDKIIWDVGHQCYPHKILTGRRDQFDHIRCDGGLSGFPKRDESPYDSFGTGHASTSISAAMGMAAAIRLSGSGDNVVAVIGDGGLTGGIALEALNQTRPEMSNLTVILNDNEMSIAPSVGRMSTWLSRTVVSKPAMQTAKLLRRAAEPLPDWLYDELSHLGRRWRQSLLTFWTPGTLFEALGFHYIGPLDGHDMGQVLEALQHARVLDEPALVHVLTTKGKGYEFAEKEPCAFHGIGPFDIETGECEPKDGPPSYTKVFADTMVDLFDRYPKLVGITAAMPQGTGLDKVAKEYPDRTFDLGITEPHCVTYAAGMACEGFRPVVAIYSTFLQRTYDQLVHDVCLQNLPVIFCLDRAGIVGEDGPTHHGMFDLSYLSSLPNMTIMCPSDENEFRHMLKTAAVYEDGPVAIRYPRGRGTGCALDTVLVEMPIGKGQLLQEGKDVTIIAIGNRVQAAVAAADELSAKGVDAAVINARFAKPLDEDLIVEWANKTSRVVTVEENVVSGGFGAAVLSCLSRNGLDRVAVRVMGIDDKFVEHGNPSRLRRDYRIDAESIVETCLSLIDESKPASVTSIK